MAAKIFYYILFALTFWQMATNQWDKASVTAIFMLMARIEMYMIDCLRLCVKTDAWPLLLGVTVAPGRHRAAH